MYIQKYIFRSNFQFSVETQTAYFIQQQNWKALFITFNGPKPLQNIKKLHLLI